MIVMRSGKRIIILVAVLAAVGQISNTIAVPAMSLMAHVFLIKIHYIQSLIGCYLLAYGVSQFVYGPLSDTIGRRKTIIIGLGVYICGAALALSATKFSMLLSATIVQGLGIGVGGVMSRTVIRDLYSGKKLHQENSKMSMLLIVAPLIAPLLGGLCTDTLGWRAIYAFLLIFSVSCLMLQLAFFKETKPKSLIKYSWWQLNKTVLGNTTFTIYASLLLLAFSMVAIFEACASLLLTNTMGYSATATSILFTIPLPGYLMGSYFSSKLAKTRTISEICKLAITWISLSTFLLLLFALLHILNTIVIIAPITGILLGVGLIFPAATTGALQPFSGIAGTAGAILGGVQNLGSAICVGVSSTLSQTTQLPLAICLSVLAIFMCLVGSRLKLCTDSSQKVESSTQLFE